MPKVPAWQKSELNTYFEIQYRKKDIRKHRRRVSNIKSNIDNKRPKKFTHLSSTTTRQSFPNSEYQRIDSENRKLLRRLHGMANEKSRYPTYESKRPKNVGILLRQSQKDKILRENEILARRIRSAKPTYKRSSWNSQYKNHKKVMNERMKRHAVLLHGPKAAKKLEERKYCGNNRSYSDIGSDVDFSTTTTEQETSDRDNTDQCDTESQSQVRSSSEESSGYQDSIDEEIDEREKVKKVIDSNKDDKDPNSNRDNKNSHDGIQETCFNLNCLDKVINPDIPEIAMRPVEKDEPEEVSDWEDDFEWKQQEYIKDLPNKGKSKIVHLGVQI